MEVTMHRREYLRQHLAKSALLPAPMCNYTDRPFRELMRVMGAHLVYTEMYSSEAMVRGDPKTFRLLDFQNEESPVVVQIFGSRPDLMAEAARMVVRHGADIVDLNMGCPAKKVTKTGSGSALAEDLTKACAIIRAIRQAVDIPFTVKMRWQPDGKALELARICQDEGVDAVTLHARTRAQGYSGTADWDWIAQMKQHLTIPMIGNGDICKPGDAIRMKRQTGCDAVMAGRGLVGNPWLMLETVRMVRAESVVEESPTESLVEPELPPAAERLPVLMKHAELMYLHRGTKGMVEFRKHCAGYIKGLPGARQARPELMQVSTLEDLREKLTAHFGEFAETLE